MTKAEINLFKKGNKCQICTGCGRCDSGKTLHVVNEFFYPQDRDVKKEWRTFRPPYLIVADIGTTTIAMQLRNTEDGKILDNFVMENPQRQYGADVLSRIAKARDIFAKKAMRKMILDVLAEGIERFGVQGRLVIAANTTMVYLLMDYDIEELGQYPFEATHLEEIKTKICGMETLILPGISAFVGGDITAAVRALSIQSRNEITLLLDLGTNGEIVLGNRDKLLATSTAAGPAFEGGTDGYGADLLALVARLLQEGMVDETGLLMDPYFEKGITIGGISVTQADIRRLQMAKAAICAGISIVASKYGLTNLRQIEKVFLAGGMGYYLKPEAAVAIGLLPAVLADRTYGVGNAALEGAFCYAMTECEEIAPCYEVFNLAEEDTFSERYIAHMSLEPCKRNID